MTQKQIFPRLLEMTPPPQLITQMLGKSGSIIKYFVFIETYCYAIVSFHYYQDRLCNPSPYFTFSLFFSYHFCVGESKTIVRRLRKFSTDGYTFNIKQIFLF